MFGELSGVSTMHDIFVFVVLGARNIGCRSSFDLAKLVSFTYITIVYDACQYFQSFLDMI